MPSSPSLVGRDAPRSALVDLVASARRGRGGLAVVSGEAGIGKTALVQAVADDAALAGAPPTWGRAWEFADAPAYFPLRPCLRSLGVERIDLYQHHAPDPRVPVEESVGTLADLQREGKIRYIGLSEVTPEEIEAAQQIVPIVSVQNRYSLADRRHDATLTWCEACGIAFMPWYPIAAGKLLQPSHPAAQTLSRIAATHKATVAQISLAWLLARSPVMLPIPGTSRLAHLEENIAAASLKLSAEDIAALNALPS